MGILLSFSLPFSPSSPPLILLSIVYLLLPISLLFWKMNVAQNLWSQGGLQSTGERMISTWFRFNLVIDYDKVLPGILTFIQRCNPGVKSGLPDKWSKESYHSQRMQPIKGRQHVMFWKLLGGVRWWTDFIK